MPKNNDTTKRKEEIVLARAEARAAKKRAAETRRAKKKETKEEKKALRLKIRAKKKERRAERRGAKPEKTGKQRALFVLNLLCALSGTFFCLVYLPYFFWHFSKGHVLDVLVSLGVFASVLLPFFLRKPLRKLLKKAYTPLKIVWGALLCFYMITFSVFTLYVNFHSDRPVEESGKQTVVLVFGCQVRDDGVLSAELNSRLKTALSVLEEYPDALCIVTGGKGDDEPTSEASVMKAYLVSKGVDEARILMEERSSDTDENVRFSLELLKERGFDPENCYFICVSSTFHTPRIYLLFSRASSADCATVSAPTPYLFNRWVYTVREYMSYVYLLLFGR